VSLETPVRLNDKQKKRCAISRPRCRIPHSPQSKGWMDKVKDFFQ
jgi:molecular chaperone DnaJ